MPVNEHPIRGILLALIRERIKNHPRSLQKRIGPSEIGHPCDRWMAYKLNDTPVIPREKDSWPATVGTFVHAGLQGWFDEFDLMMIELTGNPMWFTEGRVNVGHVDSGDGYDVYGSGDLYAALFDGVVVDWKIVGKTTLDLVRRKEHPGEQYRVQTHSYGTGWIAKGFHVETVSAFFLPASGSLSQSILWHEPYDPTVSVDALKRVSRIQRAVDADGNLAPVQMDGTDHHCQDRCEWFRPKSDDLEIGCPGVNVKERLDKAHKLLG